MLRIYKQYRKAEDPNIKDAWIYEDQDTLEEIYSELYDKFLDAVFGNQTKLSREEFIDLLQFDQKQWLQPHFLRQEVFAKIIGKLAEIKKE